MLARALPGGAGAQGPHQPGQAGQKPRAPTRAGLCAAQRRAAEAGPGEGRRDGGQAGPRVRGSSCDGCFGFGHSNTFIVTRTGLQPLEMAGRLAHGSDVSFEAVEIEPEFSCVEGADWIADGTVGGCRGAGLVDPVQDVALARADCELELGGWPAELAVTTGGCLDLDPEVRPRRLTLVSGAAAGLLLLRAGRTIPRSGSGGRGVRSGAGAAAGCETGAAGRGDSADRTTSLLRVSASETVSSSSASAVSSRSRMSSACQAILRRVSSRCISPADRQRNRK